MESVVVSKENLFHWTFSIGIFNKLYEYDHMKPNTTITWNFSNSFSPFWVQTMLIQFIVRNSDFHIIIILYSCSRLLKNKCVLFCKHLLVIIFFLPLQYLLPSIFPTFTYHPWAEVRLFRVMTLSCAFLYWLAHDSLLHWLFWSLVIVY